MESLPSNSTSEPPSDLIARIRHDLLQPTKQLASRVRLLVRLRAFANWFAWAAGFTILLIAADYAMHLDEPGLRWLLAVSWLVGVFGLALYFVVPFWKLHVSNQQIATWIEKHHPRDSVGLASTIALLEVSAAESDLRFGSPQLRMAALSEAAVRLKSVPWNNVLAPYASSMAIALISTTVLGIVGLSIAVQDVARAGIVRLAMPWVACPWPIQDDLQISSAPNTIAYGSRTTIEIVDALPPLPPKVTLEIRPVDRSPGRESDIDRIAMQSLQGSAVCELPPQWKSFEVRAVGGEDNRMAWHRIEVVQPPVILNSRFTVTPPEYSYNPDTVLVGDRISVLRGSRVRFEANLSEGIASTHVEWLSDASTSNSGQSTSADRQSPSSETRENSDISKRDAARVNTANLDTAKLDTAKLDTAKWVAVPSTDPTHVTLTQSDGHPLLCQQSFSWRLRFRTQTGLEWIAPTVWSIEVIPDAAPTISMVPFASNHSTREAKVAVMGQANDDQELASIHLKWKAQVDNTTNTSKDRQLWSRNGAAQTSNPKSSTKASPGSSSEKALQVNIDTSIGLLELIQDSPEDPIEVWLEATDSLGQVGRSNSQTVTILSSEAILARTRDEQSKLADQLELVVDAQRQNQLLLERTSHIWDETERLTKEQIDSLIGARQIQESIAQQLGSGNTSLKSKLESLSNSLEGNHLAESPLAREIQSLLDKLQQDVLPHAQKAASDIALAQDVASQVAQNTNLPDSVAQDLQSRLATSQASEQALTRSLAELSSVLKASQTLQSLAKETADILQKQEELRQATQQFQQKRLTGASQTERDSDRIALRTDQRGLARSLDQLLNQLKQQADSADDTNQSDRIVSAWNSLQESQVSEQMREAANQIDDDRPADAQTVQRQVAQSIRTALAELDEAPLSKRSAPDQQDLAEFARAVAALKEQQRAVVNQFRNTTSDIPPASKVSLEECRELARRQDAVREQASQLNHQSKESKPFDWLFESIDEDMIRAVASAERQKIEPDAVHSAGDALVKLETLAEIVSEIPQATPKAPNSPSNQDSQASEAEESRQPSFAIENLKLIRALQQKLLVETESLSADQNLETSRQSESRLIHLAQQQERLAVELRKLLEQPRENP